MKFDDIKGANISRLYYRGKDIFTIVVSVDGRDIGVNFLECILLDESGVIGETIEIAESQKLGFRNKCTAEKANLNPLDYIEFFIRTNNSNELIIASKTVILDKNIQLYNPISEDKYPNQPSFDELRRGKSFE